MITLIESTPLNTQVAAIVQVTTIGSPGPQGPSALSASVVVMLEDATSVTLAVGSYALVSEGADPYPHIVVRSEFA